MKWKILALVLGLALSSAVVLAQDKTDAFVCPVLSEKVGMHNPNTFAIGGGHYSLIPSGEPHIISVPVHATNADGAGSPPGPHSEPGDTDYTSIWAG